MLYMSSTFQLKGSQGSRHVQNLRMHNNTHLIMCQKAKGVNNFVFHLTPLLAPNSLPILSVPFFPFSLHFHCQLANDAHNV